MLSRLSDRLAAFFRATAPDPFVIAVLLTALTFVLALTMTGATPGAILDSWSGASGVFGKDGVWRLMAFSMQMCLILVTGAALAESRPVSAMLSALAAVPRTPGQAVAMVALVACLLGLLNWGLGLVGGAIIARRVGIAMARRGVAVHYPLLAAAGYMGMLVWHGGLSGTAPLKVTTEAGLKEALGAAAAGMKVIPLIETIFSPLNLVVTGGLLFIVPVVMALMHPRVGVEVVEKFVEGVDTGCKPVPLEGVEKAGEKSPLIPRLLDETPIVTAILVALIGWWAWRYYLPHGVMSDWSLSGITRLTPDSVNLTMLLVGLVLHGTPRRYLAAVDEAVKGCGGIIIQFPLYAGIMSMMDASGLTGVLAGAISGNASAGTLPLLTLLAATVVGLFIPSGGAQWAVQGPVAMQSGAALGVEPGTLVMAVAYGDQLANMPQPFWALPLLAITGVKAREIIGYTVVMMVVAGVWTGVWMWVL
jgi:short-chain fatty acids transporter